MMRLDELVHGIADVRVHGPDRYDVTGIELDSRRIEPGFLFAALVGSKVDGRDFVGEALRRGACAVLSAPPRPEQVTPAATWIESGRPRRSLALLARRFSGQPDERMAVVGITGTDGKTTTTTLLAAALEEAGIRAATSGTLGQRFGARSSETALTTQEAPHLWAFLEQSASEGAAVAAIEVSSAALDAERVHGLEFAGAVLTGLGHDHLDLHGTPEAYRRAKRSLFEMLGEDAFAVLPDGPAFDDFRRATRARVLTFGDRPNAKWRIMDHRATTIGARFRLRGHDFDDDVETMRPARFDAFNLAAAVAAAVELGADPRRAARGAASVRVIDGRWESIDEGQPFFALVDYAHTPEALERSLRLLRSLSSGRVIVVFGCGGDRDPTKRSEMGRVAALLADLVIVTDDNPRGEDPEVIARAIIDGAADGPAVVERIVNRAQAIVRAVDATGDEDVLLIAGKGHERYQELGDRRLLFDDRQTLRAALRTSTMSP
ncbi:MAG: UDP-N-acetylmuramoyl-L-alanyl-D-glutamate--2,6-diaminopimelate ligase [Acidobacteriota bacterium]|nr:UDP-N-acetylmuramoyl-L-alanyl-D-glutamate--2,6-diaminopimelate ligase [Acidobacteriota bacterium]